MQGSFDSVACTEADVLPETARQALKSISWRKLGRLSDASASVCLIGFDWRDFDPAAFEAVRMACPPTISRSVQKRQAEYFFGRMAARFSMSAMGLACSDIAIGPAREPLWPEAVVGSITHNDEYAAAVVLERRDFSGVGIDIESVVSADAMQALLTTCISAAELAYLQTVDLHINSLVTVVFSAKESLFKAAFPTVQRFFDFSAAEVTHFDVRKSFLTLVLTETLTSELRQGRIVQVHFDFIVPAILFTSTVFRMDRPTSITATVT